MRFRIVLCCCLPAGVWAQEASSGFELRATVTGAGAYTHRLAAEPRSGTPLTGGLRSLLYPTWKLSRNWSVSGAIQVHSRPFFFEPVPTIQSSTCATLRSLGLHVARVHDPKNGLGANPKSRRTM